MLAVALALGCYALSRFGLAFIDGTTQISALWPGGGVVLGIFLLAPARRWPAFAAAVFVGNLAAQLQVALLDRWLPPAEAPVEDPVASEAPSAGGLIDAPRLLELHERYGDVAARLVELFAHSTPESLRELRVAVERGDREALRAAAHKLKGSCQNVGAVSMADACRRLEAGGSDAHATLAALAAAFEPTLAALRAL